MIPATSLWDSNRVREAFIHRLRPATQQPDIDIWGPSRDGEYTTKSAYKFLSSIHEHKAHLPELWKSIWKATKKKTFLVEESVWRFSCI